MDSDEVAYRRSVRNMSVILAAIVITVFAAIFVSSYVSPHHDVFQNAVTYDSPNGFTMHLTVTPTSDSPTWGVTLEGWVNSTSPSIENITAADSWAVSQSRLWTSACTSGFPIGVGVMQGHYNQDNFTLGTLLPLNRALFSPCVGQTYSSPTSFAFEPRTSKALVVLGGAPKFWGIQTSLHFTGTTAGYGLQPGVYTAVLADEWGDVLTTNFLESWHPP